jgi:pimeloyl-ACP methyl ester carboxylesterase
LQAIRMLTRGESPESLASKLLHSDQAEASFGVSDPPGMNQPTTAAPVRLARCCLIIAFCALLPQPSLTAKENSRGKSGVETAGGTSARWPAAMQKLKLPGIDDEVWNGTFTVFENRQTKTGRTIDLNVIVLPAWDGAATQEPLFELAGGPGIAITDSATVYATDMRDYRRHRDVVLVDQRGTGKSNPLKADPDPRAQRFLAEIYPVEYVKQLRQKLEQRADLTQYTTPVAMDDLDDVRAWLGYDRINLYGLSYGSRAAMVYLRQHPEHVRSVILMGVSPTFQKMPLYHARDGERAMNLLLDECERDPVAAKAFPQVRRELAELLARLEREPARVRYVSPDRKVDTVVEIQRDIFAEKLRNQLYDVATSRRIPLIIHRAAQGDFAPFLQVAIPKDLAKPDFIADGMYLCVTVAEDTALVDEAAAARMNAGNIFGNYRVAQQVRAARLWPRGKLPPGYDQPVVSDVPVLLISGYQDPVTPPQWAEEVARHLSRSRHVILKHGAHLPDNLSHYECLDKLMMEFLDAGDAAQLDIHCVEQMLPPPFVTEG